MAREYTKEAQQELMEKSLRNVRGLVDKIEAEEAARKRTQKWVIAAIVGVTLLLIVAIAAMVAGKNNVRPITVSPPAQTK
jgi:1-deoxy-D-xylulose 5-phosphate reductoisomerase